MTEEFKKARDEFCEHTNDDYRSGRLDGADWAYEYMANEHEHKTMELIEALRKIDIMNNSRCGRGLKHRGIASLCEKVLCGSK
jgi:hypothetical protein